MSGNGSTGGPNAWYELAYTSALYDTGVLANIPTQTIFGVSCYAVGFNCSSEHNYKAQDGRHSAGADYLFCDGHVKWLHSTSVSAGTSNPAPSDPGTTRQLPDRRKHAVRRCLRNFQPAVSGRKTQTIVSDCCETSFAERVGIWKSMEIARAWELISEVKSVAINCDAWGADASSILRRHSGNFGSPKDGHWASGA